MDTKSAIKMGVRLAMETDRREIYEQVLDWRHFRSDFVRVLDQHKQALALVCKHMSMTVAERAELLSNSWFADWTLEEVPEGVSCWISRKGMIYAIGYANHTRFSELIGLGGSTSPLESAGWIHVSGGRADIMYEPTSIQTKALHKIREWGHVRESRSMFRHGAPKPHPILMKLDRVPRENFVADANFWADEHRSKDDDAVAI